MLKYLFRWKWILGILIVAAVLVFLVIQHFSISLYHPFRLQVSSIALTSNGNILATVGQDEVDVLDRRQLRFWDIQTGSEINLLDVQEAAVDIAFSRDGTQVALVNDNLLCPGVDLILILTLPGGVLRREISGYTSSHGPFPCRALDSPTFSPDGTLIAFVNRNTLPDTQCCGGNSVQVWDIERNRLRSEISGEYSSVAYSPDGDTLALGKDNLVVLWSIEARAVSRRFEGHTGLVNSVAFSPDGTLVASADNQTIRLWYRQSGQQAALHHSGASDITYSPDGSQLIYAWGAHVSFWNLPEL